MTQYRIGIEHIKAQCCECGDCWEWQGIASKAGVPKINIWNGGPTKHGRTVLSTRRVVWELTKGPILRGKLITPNCGNVKCLNPDHLVYTDHSRVAAKNGARADVKLRKSATLSGRGRKLSAEQAAFIRASDGATRDLAEEFGVGISVVNRIRSGVLWRERNPFAGLFAANDYARRKA